MAVKKHATQPEEIVPPLGVDEIEELPRGPHSLKEEVLNSQRGRMMRAVAFAVAEKGYGEMIVADVTDRAHVSRRTFYEHFDDLQDCYRQAHATTLDAMGDLLERIYEEGGYDGFETIRQGLRAWFSMIAAQPVIAQAFWVDALSAGPLVMRKRDETTERGAALFVAAYERAREADPELPEPLPLAGPAAMGIINEICLSALRKGSTADLPGLSDEAATLLISTLTAGGSRSNT